MLLKMFAVHDQKANAFITPFFLPEKGMATRSFSDCLNSSDHQFGRNPEDYTLFYLGHFDNVSGETTVLNVHESLGNGITYLNPVLSDDLPAQESGNGKATQRNDSSIQSGSKS